MHCDSTVLFRGFSPLMVFHVGKNVSSASDLLTFSLAPTFPAAKKKLKNLTLWSRATAGGLLIGAWCTREIKCNCKYATRTDFHVWFLYVWLNLGIGQAPQSFRQILNRKRKVRKKKPAAEDKVQTAFQKQTTSIIPTLEVICLLVFKAKLCWCVQSSPVSAKVNCARPQPNFSLCSSLFDVRYSPSEYRGRLFRIPALGCHGLSQCLHSLQLTSPRLLRSWSLWLLLLLPSFSPLFSLSSPWLR